MLLIVGHRLRLMSGSSTKQDREIPGSIGLLCRGKMTSNVPRILWFKFELEYCDALSLETMGCLSLAIILSVIATSGLKNWMPFLKPFPDVHPNFARPWTTTSVLYRPQKTPYAGFDDPNPSVICYNKQVKCRVMLSWFCSQCHFCI